MLEPMAYDYEFVKDERMKKECLNCAILVAARFLDLRDYNSAQRMLEHIVKDNSVPVHS